MDAINLDVISYARGLSVTAWKREENDILRSVGVADLSWLTGLWKDRMWFGRLLVHENYRNHGVGSFILRRIQEEATKLKKGIHCCPHPYDGSKKLPDLIRFYLRHDFVQEPEALVWDPN